MQTEHVTTPFGRRSMSLVLVRRQIETADIKPGKSAEKWKIFRDVSTAMDVLKIQPNSIAVLDALLSFYPDNQLRHDAQMVVFPSNVQLALRAHGLAGATLRRHIAVLVEAGLIVRKDSANGKRYARKNRGGDIETAFGFDLSPLLARAEELALMAQQVMEDRIKLRTARESLTICRRDVRKLITAAMEEGAVGDWQAMEETYLYLISRIPRNPSLADLEAILDELKALRSDVINRLTNQQISQNNSGIHAQTEQHIQNSNTQSTIELEPANEKEQGEALSEIRPARCASTRAFPLGIVLKACPTISDYGSGGAIANWRDLMSAAVVVRSMLGVSPSAYQDACEAMGPENAAIAMACILERVNFINSAGGYLRDLTRRSQRGEFSLGPMVMALLKANGQSGLQFA